MYIVLGAAVFCFCLLQFFLRVVRSSLWDSSNYVYLVFGVGITRAVEYYFYTNPHLLDLDRLGSECSWEESVILGISAGYFLYDIPLSLYMKEVWYLFLHHLLSFLIVVTAWYYNKSGFDLLLCLWLGEFSCPCCFFIFYCEDKPHKQNNKWMRINQMGFAITFLICRFVIGPFLVYQLFMSRDTLMAVKLGCVMFYVVNFALLKKIILQIVDFYKSLFSKTTKETQKK